MQRHPDYTRRRIQQLADRLKGKIYSECRPLSELVVAGPIEQRISYSEAMKLDFAPAQLGMQLGPDWHTYWFKASFNVPAEWEGKRLDLLWNTHSENTLWMNGQSVQGMNAGEGQARPDATLIDQARAGEVIAFVMETACNKHFGVKHGNKQFSHISEFVLDRADVGMFDPFAWELYFDFYHLVELEKSFSNDKGDTDHTFAGELLYELNRFANTIDEEDPQTWPEAHEIIKPLLARKNGSVVHELTAIGHAHIDTAWLWPLAETTRKCQRSFGTATRYMLEYPEYKFSCSQAYQYDTIMKADPPLFERIKQAYERGQWIPVGGTWIEPDCNIPSGEALMRQFLYGQRYFEKHFGKRCKEFWNPDVFGYNGQLPQIMQHCGITRFLTQKLSWNKFNQPHFHTFNWVAVDGSKVLAHFPPADTYNAHATVAQLRFNARNYKDADRSSNSMMLFGHGDGGGGPTRWMLENIKRSKDLQGLPRTEIRSSEEFFERLEAEDKPRLEMVGELYFEYHRGTYTTQALTKLNNRRGEDILHNIELLSAIAGRSGRLKYDNGKIEALWRIVLLNQFHDILPGSSITPVYEDARQQFEAIFAEAKPMLAEAAKAAVGDGEQELAINTVDAPRLDLVEKSDGDLVALQAEGMGIAREVTCEDSVALREEADMIVVENAALRATLARDGRILSLVHKASGREALAEPGNVFEIYDDRPTAYDAWDVDPYHLEAGKSCAPADQCEIARQDAMRAEVKFSQPIGKKSRITYTIRLEALSRKLAVHCEADWQESHKFLKVAFPMNAQAMNATYEMQYHAVERPTHYNNSYDLAKFEVPAHRWADLSEHRFGVAILNDCKYGYSTFGNRMHLSLLRAPKHPDPSADMGQHQFAYAIYPHEEDWRTGQVVNEAACFNQPLLWSQGRAEPATWFEVEDDNLMLDAVKKAEDSDAMVLRFYEKHGSRGNARVKINLPFEKACYCNGLEDAGEAIRVEDGNAIVLPYRPWQVVSVMVR